MLRRKPLLLSIAALAATAGFAAFRPDRLFVDQTVSEAAPASAVTIAEGTFASYAHETVGTARIVTSGGKSFLRLSGFSTSNGPDVRILLVKGDDPRNTDKANVLDLGSIKGNKGDQNYPLPDGAADAYGAVNVWCARFSVGFGGAVLVKKAAATESGYRLASFAEAETVVTSGKLGRGTAAIVESSGKRILRLTGVVARPALRVTLHMTENPPASAAYSAAPKLDLGALKGRNAAYAVPKDIDLWLYRSVTLYDPIAKKVVLSAALRSDQERKKAFALV